MKLTVILEVDDNVTLSASRRMLVTHKANAMRAMSGEATEQLIQRAIDLGLI